MWGDLLMLEVEESYRALPRKTLAGMDFVLNRFLAIFSRPGRSQGLLYKHLCDSFINSFSNGL